MLLYYFFERGEAVKRWRNEKWLQKIPYYCYTAHSENGPIDGTWSTYLLDVLFACSTAVTHVKMTTKHIEMKCLMPTYKMPTSSLNIDVLLVSSIYIGVQFVFTFSQPLNISQ